MINIMNTFSYGSTDPHALWIALFFFLLQVYISKEVCLDLVV